VLISSEFILGEIWTHLWIIELVKMNDFFWYLDGFPISTQFHDGFFFSYFFASWIANFNSYAFSLAMILIAVVVRYRGRETLYHVVGAGMQFVCYRDDHQLMSLQLI